jgi:hypothetical protein
MDDGVAWFGAILDEAVRAGIITRRQAADVALLVPPAPPTEVWAGTPYAAPTSAGMALGDVLLLTHGSWADLADWLNDAGVRTPRGKRFTAATARANLVDRFERRTAELHAVLTDDDLDRLEVRAFASRQAR